MAARHEIRPVGPREHAALRIILKGLNLGPASCCSPVASAVLRPAAVRAGLGAIDADRRYTDRHYTGVVFHDLRHTFVSLMASAGVHVSVIASIVGHKDGGALLLRRYRHLFPHEQKAAMAAFEHQVVNGGVAQGCKRPPVSRPSGRQTRCTKGWAVQGSNLRPPACKAGSETAR